MEGHSRQNKHTLALSAAVLCLCVFGIYYFFLILLAIEKDSEEPLILLPSGAVYLSSKGSMTQFLGPQVSPACQGWFGEFSHGLVGGFSPPRMWLCSLSVTEALYPEAEVLVERQW